MPLDAWLLLVASIGLGLGLELAFMWAQLRERRAGGRDGERDGERDGGWDR